MSDARPEYLTAPEVAKMLRLSVKSIYRLAKSDASMPALRLTDGTIRFPSNRLATWLDERTQGRRSRKVVQLHGSQPA